MTDESAAGEKNIIEFKIHLEKCPFCNGTPFISDWAISRIQCNNCFNCTIAYHNLLDAVDAWNQRVINLEEYERLKRLDENVKETIAELKKLNGKKLSKNLYHNTTPEIELLESLND